MEEGNISKEQQPVFNAEFWVDGFKLAYQTGEYSDITIRANNKEYRVHKIIITRKSEFFREKILSEPDSPVIYVEDPNNCIESVLEYLYMGSVRVQPSNIDALLSATEYFGLSGLATEIMNVVQSQFVNDKDLIFLYLSRGSNTKIACSNYIKSHFSELSEAGCFFRLKVTDLSPKEFFSIIVEEELNVHSEQDVCTAILDYIKKNKSELTSEDLGLLFSAVRFPYITGETLVGLYTEYRNILPVTWTDALIQRLSTIERIPVPKSLQVTGPRQSYAKGVAENLLTHVLTGGTCRLIEYQFYNGAAAYNAGTLDAPPTATWANNGCLMDSPVTKNNAYLSYRVNSSIGSTWTNSAQNNGTGVLVIDLTCVKGDTRTLRRFTLFQMVSDGTTSAVQISAHTSTDMPPVYTDNSWFVVLPWKDVGPAVLDANPPGSDANGNTVKSSGECTIPIVTTRYLKIELRNDGRNGHPGYIELRQIKGYSL